MTFSAGGAIEFGQRMLQVASQGMEVWCFAIQFCGFRRPGLHLAARAVLGCNRLDSNLCKFQAVSGTRLL